MHRMTILALAIGLVALVTGLTSATAAGATLGDWKRAMVRANRASETPVRVHRSLNYRASWGFAARATAWRVSGAVFGMRRTARLTPALRKRLRPYLPRRTSSSPPRLSASQIRRAQTGVPGPPHAGLRPWSATGRAGCGDTVASD